MMTEEGCWHSFKIRHVCCLALMQTGVDPIPAEFHSTPLLKESGFRFGATLLLHHYCTNRDGYDSAQETAPTVGMYKSNLALARWQSTHC